MRRHPSAIRSYRDAFTQRDLVHELDRLAARAWPALTVVDLDGWRLRTSQGFTRRANSVWPRTSGSRLALETKIANVEAHYLRRGLTPTFQLSPAAAPSHLDRALAGRGYRASAPVEVRATPLSALLERLRADAARVGPVMGPQDQAGHSVLGLTSEPTEAWLDAWAEVAALPAGTGELSARILRRLTVDAAYARLDIDGRAAAVGRAVLDGGWLGLASIVTTPAQRRHGCARRVMAALVRWGLERSAERAWVAVERDNAAGVGLWHHHGFRQVYTYRFRSLPLAGASTSGVPVGLRRDVGPSPVGEPAAGRRGLSRR